MPSISYENLPLSIMEAFARGKPVVGSDCGGIPELVEDGSTGYLFDPYDHRALADAVTRIMEDSAVRRSMGRQARDLIASRYSPEVHYDALMEIYRRLLE
jgi:glycosyltransferase involved in cell wall biosynthesis